MKAHTELEEFITENLELFNGADHFKEKLSKKMQRYNYKAMP